MIDKEFWSGKRVLVTGHTGFKGSWLIQWLLSMESIVWGISLKPNKSERLYRSIEETLRKEYKERYRSIEGNILNRELLLQVTREARPDIVFHLAAQALVRYGYDNCIETWETNLMGSLNVLESVKQVDRICSVIMVTTDKVYKNNDWDYPYREIDRLGGSDPYSASKAGAEIAINSWRQSYCGQGVGQKRNLGIATARAGNVIGGGDWAEDRLIPDMMRAFESNSVLNVRNPESTRPWQHVLEPLCGYLVLAQALHRDQTIIRKNSINRPIRYTDSFNFGPLPSTVMTVKEVVAAVRRIVNIRVKQKSGRHEKAESKKLNLDITKAMSDLGWKPMLSTEEALRMTAVWYLRVLNDGMQAYDACKIDIDRYRELIDGRGID